MWFASSAWVVCIFRSPFNITDKVLVFFCGTGHILELTLVSKRYPIYAMHKSTHMVFGASWGLHLLLKHSEKH